MMSTPWARTCGSGDDRRICQCWELTTPCAGKSVALTAARLLSERANIWWTTTIHTGTVIPISATGIGDLQFLGWMDNTQVAIKMFNLMEFKR